MNEMDPGQTTPVSQKRTNSLPDPEQRDWRQLARRGWPLIAAALAILLVVALAFSRRGNDAEGAEQGSVEAREREGTADTVVTLDSAAQRFAGIELATAGTAAGNDLIANGTITYDANHASVVAPRAEGRVISVRADLGQRVNVGSVLAILESADVGETRGALERARAALDVARQNHEREKRLYEQSVSSQKEMLEAEGEYRSAQAEFNSAAARLRSVGAAAGGQGAMYNLVSPVAGTVVERNAMPGQIAGPETNLFTVANLRRLWITVDVYESDIGRVRSEAVARLSPRALPGETFLGRVSFAGGVVDTTSRTIKVRVEVDNPNLRLRPGMFAQVRIDAPPQGATTADGPIVVPELAVQELNGKAVIFVPGGAPGEFVARSVTVGDQLGGEMVAILAGLRRGEAFVAKGAFQLKSELLKATFGEEDET